MEQKNLPIQLETQIPLLLFGSDRVPDLKMDGWMGGWMDGWIDR